MGRTIRVLLVEDNPADARLVQEALAGLRSPRFRFTHVETLADADQYFDPELTDVVLLDLALPDSPRMRTLASMHRPAARVPVIVLTGIEDETLGMWMALEGVQGYLIKGRASADQLAEAIRRAIREHKPQPGSPAGPSADAAEVTS